ncbi:MAG TPA: hypothetical protein VIG32_06285 [Candidatus Baltobacteraceae bacterium]|jgi:hypothetical protein
MFETIACAHDLCNCVVTESIEGVAYCSDACRAAATAIESDTCPCGHPPCDTP